MSWWRSSQIYWAFYCIRDVTVSSSLNLQLQHPCPIVELGSSSGLVLKTPISAINRKAHNISTAIQITSVVCCFVFWSTQISSLVTLKLLARVSTGDVLDSVKYKVRQFKVQYYVKNLDLAKNSWILNPFATSCISYSITYYASLVWQSLHSCSF